MNPIMGMMAKARNKAMAPRRSPRRRRAARVIPFQILSMRDSICLTCLNVSYKSVEADNYDDNCNNFFKNNNKNVFS